MSNSTGKPTEHITEAVAEPGPDWPVAKEVWGFAWQLHWIGFGILFGSLAVHCFVALLQVNTRKGFGRKPLSVTINLLLLVLGVTRALYLFLDPYESRENGIEDPKWMTLLLFGIAFPCLTSAFSLIHLAFLEVTKLKIGPGKLQNVRYLAGVIAIHFAIVFVAESTASIKPELDPLLIVCQSFFILWGLFLSGSFIYSGCKVMNRVQNVESNLHSVEKLGTHLPRQKTKSSTSKVAKITLATSFLGFAVCGLHLYSMVGVYGLYSDVVHPSPWPWLGFQSSFRLVEIAMACTIAYSVMQPSERNCNEKASTSPNVAKKQSSQALQEKRANIAGKNASNSETFVMVDA